MSLKEYQRKRDFHKTDEPQNTQSTGPVRQFVIQKHAASRLHYDLRLRLGGTLKSWALPKGMPYTLGEKRLAVQVEDHPVSYSDFEGTIPKGEYGGGSVMIWDRGSYKAQTRSPGKDLERGKLHFALQGEKLRGEWYLVRLKGEKNQWLIIKGGSSMKPLAKSLEDRSAATGRSMQQIAAGEKSAPVKKRQLSVKKNPGTAALPSASLPAFIEPMKARFLAEAPSGDWFYEIKFDGWRAMVLLGEGEVRILSRNNNDLGDQFPELVDAFHGMKVSDSVIDGEIVALDPSGKSSFQELQSLAPEPDGLPIFFYAFDLLRFKGKDLRALPIEKRKSILEKLINPRRDPIRFSAGLGDDTAHLLKQAKTLGLEGLIGKQKGSRYEAGRRSGAWIKLKLFQEQEFVIGGFTNPQGSRKHFGAILAGYFKNGKLHYAGKVGTGFNVKSLTALHAEFKKIPRKTSPFVDLPDAGTGRWNHGITAVEMRKCHWLAPKLVCQIRFAEWTRDGRLRQPVFHGLRQDKDPQKVVREGAV